jgi:hypothetical protein
MSNHIPSDAALGRRLREVRIDLHGDWPPGLAVLSSLLSIRPWNWLIYEAGATIPAAILLGFLDLTDVDPEWLRTGEGGRDRMRHAELSPASGSPGFGA